MSDTGPEVDVSDLREYDGPDPPAVRGGCLAALGIIALGVSVAWSSLNATAVDHYIAVYANEAEYDSQREIARRYVAELPIEKVRDQVLAIERPEIRGAFHEVLAATGDAAQAEAIGAYLDTVLERYPGWDEREAAKAACVSLGAFAPDVAAPLLFSAHAGAKDEVKAAIGEAIESLPPGALRRREYVPGAAQGGMRMLAR